jgi:prephenate dehydrogenase
MSIRQITIVGTGLIGGSFGLAAKASGFRGKIIGCDTKVVLAKARRKHAIDASIADPIEACNGSDVVLLATPVGGIIELIAKLAHHLAPDTLMTDVGSTKSEILRAAQRAFGPETSKRFLAGHPMAGKENSGIEFADPDLFRGAAWFITPALNQKYETGTAGGFTAIIKKIGAKIAVLEAAEHDQLCAWISHVPQMVSTALASALIDEYGENAPLLESGGRALREMTRIAASPYSMWRDIAITNKQSIAAALFKLEQKLAHIRENLDTRELEQEFKIGHKLNGNSRTKKKKARASRD